MEINIRQYAAVAVVGFVCGCVQARGLGPGALIGGVIMATTAVAYRALRSFLDEYATKHNWNLSTFRFTLALSGTALWVASAVAFFAIGVYSPVGLAVATSFGMVKGLAELGFGAYLKFSGSDLDYDGAKHHEDWLYQVAVKA